MPEVTKWYGRLKVLSRSGAKVVCQCRCGVVKEFFWKNVRKGLSRSCGCLRNELTVARSTKHGHNKRGQRTPTYDAWCNMRSRCTNESSDDWPLYGGRGITYDPRWDDFLVFLADVGESPGPKYEIDRWPDNNGGYTLGNVRWATQKQQARNTRKNVFLEFCGETLTIAEWAERTGIDYHCLYYRLSIGWSATRALTTPSKRVRR